MLSHHEVADMLVKRTHMQMNKRAGKDEKIEQHRCQTGNCVRYMTFV